MKQFFVLGAICCIALSPEGLRRKGFSWMERALCFGDIAMSPVGRMKAINLIRRHRLHGVGQEATVWILIVCVTTFVFY